MTHPSDAPRERLLELHWDRFTAWCSAWGKTSLPADEATVAEFLSRFPASASTQRLRRQVIRRAHTAAALPDPAPEPDQQRVWQHRDGQPTVEDVLAALPKYRFPGGMRGRRDAFLLVLFGTLGMPRTEARRLRPAAITLGATITINPYVR